MRSMRPANVTRMQFHVSAVSRADLIQEMYIRELNNYKSPPADAKAAEQATKAWKVPQSPAVPSMEDNIDAELNAYREEAVELNTSSAAATAEDGKATEVEEDWLVIEDPEEEHH